MATPKRKHKIRDYEATRKKLLETVGDILRDTGYAGLKTNNIARRAGKDKSLIRYYFQSLVNLQKAYIKENDYWFAFFENFNIPEKPGREELKTLFIDLMKANFSFFRDNIEMQKIILWQISESNPLMRSVSDQRELEGGKLLGMTDAYFRNSDINFRALIALILGGTYYLALHAETNKSTVCGIDINLEKDRQAVMTCIEQLVSRAWEEKTAPPAELQQEGRADETEMLEQLASRICLGKQTENDAALNSKFSIEAKRLQAALSQQVMKFNGEEQLSNYLRVRIYRLTVLCDALYPAGAINRQDAMPVLEIINAVTSPLYAQIPGDILLPVLFRKIEGEKLLFRWQLIEKKLTGKSTDPVLIKIMGLPFLNFISAETKLTWAEYSYLVNYATGIERQAKEKLTSSGDWMLLLISLGYNHSRFTVWCFGILHGRINGKTKEEATMALKQATLDISFRTKESVISFELRKPHIADEINQWIEEELANIAGLANSGPGALASKLAELQAFYWQKPASAVDNKHEHGKESLKFIEAKLLIMLEHVRHSMDN